MSRPDWIERGSRLREARVAAGLTQENLGVKSGIDRQTVNKMEKGRGGISPDKANRLAPHLAIDPRDRYELRDASERTQEGNPGTWEFAYANAALDRMGDLDC